MDNFTFEELRDFFVAARDKSLTAVKDYVAYLSVGEVVLIVFFLSLLSLVFLWLVLRAIKGVINRHIQKKRAERKAMLKQDMRLDRVLVQVDDEPSGDVEKNDVAEEGAFDWSRENKLNKSGESVKEADLQYKLKPCKLQNLLGLIIDLLGRGAEELKLAQVIMYKNQHLNSEDDVIYTIAAIKLFVKMCKNGAFKNMNSDKVLPRENIALFNLANGDCSLVLQLLETYIDNAWVDVSCLDDENEKRRKMYEIANVSLCFGTFAMLEDVALASGAFELAIELNPKNSVAWCRLGDAYKQMGKNDKAVWAYANVMNSDSEDVFNQQLANAGRALYSYYKEKGKKELAAKMLEDSYDYYEKIGINAPLTERELMIIRIVEENEKDAFEDIVDDLLSKQ